MKFPTLYTRTADGAINYWSIETIGSIVRTEWGRVDTGVPQTEEYEAQPKNVGRSNATSGPAQAALEARAKWDKRKRLKYVESAEEARGHVNLKPMLAHALDDKRMAKLEFPVDVQPKLNGCRCMAYTLPDGSVRLMSRGGKDYDLPHVSGPLRGLVPSGWVLDGELYLHGASLQRIRSLILTPQPGTEGLRYVCYDCTLVPPTDQAWSHRWSELRVWHAAYGARIPSVRVVETSTARSADEVHALHFRYVSDGYEGAIVRTRGGAYRLGYRSHDLLKLKSFKDEEFKVVDWTVGKDGVIVYTCVQEDGIEFEVRPRGDESERAEMLRAADDAVGRWLTVRYQERSERNVPLIVSGVGIRPDADR